MQIKFSTVSRMLYLGVTVGLMYFLAQLAYGWSLNETERFMFYVFGTTYAKPASWLIQIGQQPLLLLNGLSKNQTVRNVCLVAFFAMVGIDAVTNIGAYQTWVQTVDFTSLTPDIAKLAQYTGYVMCFVVVFSEEALILLSGVVFHLIGMIVKDFGSRAPKWFLVDAVQVMAAASGARAAGIELPTGEENEEREERPTNPSTSSRPMRRRFAR